MKRVMVMCETSGLLYGELVSRVQQEVTLARCRRIYSFSGACTIDQLAVEGSKEPHKCIVTCPVERYIVLDAIEVIAMTDKSWHNLNRIRSWKATGDKCHETKRLVKLQVNEWTRQNNAANKQQHKEAHSLGEMAIIKTKGRDKK